MAWQQIEYDEVKHGMRPGDVIAFGGKGTFPDLIKSVTQSTVSHVAVVVRTDLPADGMAPARPSIQIIESTGELDEYYGVHVRRLEERIAGYDGDIWWLPLSETARHRLDLAKFSAFLLEQADLPFDLFQAALSAADDLDHVPLLGQLTYSREDFSAFFCSELVAAGLEAGGAIESLNCSEVTPLDLCQFAIYRGTYYQLKGPKTLIAGYNTIDPEGWGE